MVVNCFECGHGSDRYSSNRDWNDRSGGIRRSTSLRENGEVTIGNEYLERKFSTSDNKLATTELDNKRADLTFTPAQGSEEFIIKLRQDGTTKLDGELDRTNWTVTASDQYNNEVGAKDYPGANVIDGDASTIWHSKYSPDQPYPHSLTFDMKSEQEIAAFSYQPRQDSSTNGDIKGYKLYVGNSETDLKVMQTLRQKVILLTMTEKRSISI